MITTKAKVRSLLSTLPVLLTLYAPVSASAQETYAGSNQDVRMVLYFNVPPAALLKFLPQGWELSPATTGPTAGANLVVEFVDQLWAMDPKGVVAAPYRYVLFGMPVKHNGSNATDLMLFDGLSRGGAGPYGIAETAIDDVRQTVHSGAPDSRVDESWEFKGDSESVSLHTQFERGKLAREQAESHVYSQIKPQFSRIYRYVEGVDLLRGSGVAGDRLESFNLKAEGGKLSGIFDGREQLISVVSVPWYSRDIYVPAP
jgi:hypothetical protein